MSGNRNLSIGTVSTIESHSSQTIDYTRARLTRYLNDQERYIRTGGSTLRSVSLPVALIPIVPTPITPAAPTGAPALPATSTYFAKAAASSIPQTSSIVNTVPKARSGASILRRDEPNIKKPTENTLQRSLNATSITGISTERKEDKEATGHFAKFSFSRACSSALALVTSSVPAISIAITSAPAIPAPTATSTSYSSTSHTQAHVGGRFHKLHKNPPALFKVVEEETESDSNSVMPWLSLTQ